MNEQDKNEMFADFLKFYEYQNHLDKPKAKEESSHLFSKIIVCICIFLAIGYTGLCLLMQWVKGVQPESQLTLSFFAFIVGELSALAFIKKSDKDGGNK